MNNNLLSTIILFCSLVVAVVWIGCAHVASPDDHLLFQNSNIINRNNVIPVVIIGSGPAGLMAAVYVARERVETLVIEGDKPGGLLTETERVDNWPGGIGLNGQDIIDNLKRQALYFGATFLSDTIDQIDIHRWPYKLHMQDGQTIQAHAVIIATGSRHRTLGISGEEAYWGRGVSACALCDAPFFKDGHVVVVGGGDSAAEEAMILSAYAKEVLILVRNDHMRASVSMQERLAQYAHVTIQYNAEVQEIIGDGTQVIHIEWINTQTQKRAKEPVDGLFLAIGHEPNTDIFRDSIPIDEQGYITLIGRSQATGVPGIFAAGDVEDHVYRQAGVAAGHGIKAAIEAVRFLREQGV